MKAVSRGDAWTQRMKEKEIVFVIALESATVLHRREPVCLKRPFVFINPLCVSASLSEKLLSRHCSTGMDGEEFE